LPSFSDTYYQTVAGDFECSDEVSSSLSLLGGIRQSGDFAVFLRFLIRPSKAWGRWGAVECSDEVSSSLSDFWGGIRQSGDFAVCLRFLIRIIRQ
jgi:hypothetical protein